MSVLASSITASPDELLANRTAYEARVADLRARRAAALAAGSAAARQQQRDGGQMLVRERISALLDPGSPFLELCQLAGEGLYGQDPPGAGVVTGVGMIAGRPCMVIASDPTVNDGAYNAPPASGTCARSARMAAPAAVRDDLQPGSAAARRQAGRVRRRRPVLARSCTTRRACRARASRRWPACTAGGGLGGLRRRDVRRGGGGARPGCARLRAGVRRAPDAERANRVDGVSDRLAERRPRDRHPARRGRAPGDVPGSGAMSPNRACRCTTRVRSTGSSAPTRACRRTTARSCCA